MLHQLVMAVDCWAFLECRLEWADFSAAPLRPWSGGGQLLGEVTRGYEMDWSDQHVPPDQFDCVLVALGLLHIRVKSVFPRSWVAIMSLR